MNWLPVVFMLVIFRKKRIFEWKYFKANKGKMYMTHNIYVKKQDSVVIVPCTSLLKKR